MTEQAALPRPATSVILLRDADAPRVLMGRRQTKARFMPNVYVFPGGMVDDEDAFARDMMAEQDALADVCAERLSADARGAPDPYTLALAGIRETFEETGVRIGGREGGVAAPEGAGESWAAFAASGARPRVGGMTLVLRAVTPPSQRIRFDARIFALDADAHAIDLDDFSGASGELEDLRWLTFEEAVVQPMAFPTSLALAEVMAGAHLLPERPVPFVDQWTHESVIVGL